MKLKCSGYNIYLDNDMLDNIYKLLDLSKYSKIIVLTEKKIYNLWKNKIDTAIKYDKLIQINSGEKMKNFDTAKNILNQLIKNNADRKSLLIMECLIISPYADNNSLFGKVCKKLVSIITNLGLLKHPIMFLISSRFTPFFPPIEASTIASNVVGQLM